eukprot:CAMPEP_0175133658 /NCGR_PEP_ID=MMETSP0087-20121206/7766_1 /TAXON_ID=136419 /ORGANISM="Unknown Unknown, Strain D1" /LENGTH=288 /DNA_ID=CAMNT_0016416175 /DNA_START=522 /DNA_END=1388 /DNA_ORIENTATION=+
MYVYFNIVVFTVNRPTLVQRLEDVLASENKDERKSIKCTKNCFSHRGHSVLQRWHRGIFQFMVTKPIINLISFYLLTDKGELSSNDNILIQIATMVTTLTALQSLQAIQKFCLAQHLFPAGYPAKIQIACVLLSIILANLTTAVFNILVQENVITANNVVGVDQSKRGVRLASSIINLMMTLYIPLFWCAFSPKHKRFYQGDGSLLASDSRSNTTNDTAFFNEGSYVYQDKSLLAKMFGFLKVWDLVVRKHRQNEIYAYCVPQQRMFLEPNGRGNTSVSYDSTAIVDV